MLSIEALDKADIISILDAVPRIKRERYTTVDTILNGGIWAMIFSKSSTRTRVSFEVGIRELGGSTLFLPANEIQLGRGEPISDTARVLGRMVRGAVIRTFDQSDVEDFAKYSAIPTVNALTDREHPCQVLSDLFTIQEALGSIKDRVITFIGDGSCNVPTSWVFAAGKLGFELRIAAPEKYQPESDVLESAPANVHCLEDVRAAVEGADVLYTDVWVSMGKEKEFQERLKWLKGYRLKKSLHEHAKPGALVMHCLPAYRGMEIDEDLFEEHAETIFTQAENRLHTQKAIIKWMLQ